MKLFIPHVRYTLDEAQSHGVLHNLSPAIRTDMAITIIEASRLPGLEWKRFAIRQSEQIIDDSANNYLQSRIAEMKCLIYRVSGDMGQASLALESARPDQIPDQGDRKKIYTSNSGYIVIQRALNHIQIEQLTEAIAALGGWQPTSQPPSTIEKVVIFRKYILLGKILRYQGSFEDSLAHLEMAKHLADGQNCLDFLEDTSDLSCSLADTLLELDDPARGEEYLRIEIERQAPNYTPSLKIALAESLFAQGQFKESGHLCAEVRGLPRLLKVERLRLCIVQAKLSHVEGRYCEAFAHWTGAMAAISRFKLTNGRTTRTILRSMSDPPLVKVIQPGYDVEQRSREQLNTLDQLAVPGGIEHFIPGLRHWEEYLASRKRPRRSRI